MGTFGTARFSMDFLEAQWNSRLQQLNITGFSDAGVRGVHEVPEAFKT